jgi:hypothetical protein
MVKTEKIKVMAMLVLSTMLFSSAKEAHDIIQSLYNARKEKISANHVDVPHDHLVEEEMVYTTYRKQHQVALLVK